MTTTATFTGNVRVCFGWIEGQVANENHVSLFHYNASDGEWIDITDRSSVDTAGNTVCGTTTSFSLFALMEVKYPFTGFFRPVDNLPSVNAVRAGAAVPVKFSLGGDYGLSIFAPGYPRTQIVRCETGFLSDTIENTASAGNTVLSYDSVAGQYIYVWKTDGAWAGSCRELQVMLDDGEVYRARFAMRN